MKKRNILPVIFTCTLIICVVMSGRRPFRNLEASDIVSANVFLIPPEETIQITDLSELASLLGDVVVYHRDSSHYKYAGQGVTFTLTMSDDTQVTVTVFTPFVIIDGVGYRAKYEPCEALNSYANRLLDNEAP